jgi:hypothetical protein
MDRAILVRRPQRSKRVWDGEQQKQLSNEDETACSTNILYVHAEPG